MSDEIQKIGNAGGSSGGGGTTDLSVSSADVADNVNIKDVVGNKSDTVAGTSLVALTKQLLAGANLITSSGTYAYTDAGGEQAIVELIIAVKTVISSIWLDLVNLTQNGTVKIYHKIDGTTYREVASYRFNVASDSDGKNFSGFIVADDVKITYTEEADETASRNIPYYIG
jgi:hypothetical protein